jgi:hypothetical protein
MKQLSGNFYLSYQLLIRRLNQFDKFDGVI